MNQWMDAEYHARMAQQFLDAGQWRKAMRALETALDLSPNRVEWVMGLGMTHEALEDPASAAQAYQRAIELGMDDLETQLRLTHNLIQSGRWQSAVHRLEAITSADPDCEEAYCQQILAYAKLGDHHQAQLMFDIVMQTDEDNAQAYDYLAHSHVMQQRFDIALRLWEKVLELDPVYPGVLAHLGQAYLKVGRLGRSRKLLRRHLRRHPDDVEAMVMLGRLLVAMKRHAEADETFRIAAEMSPGSASVHLALGELALMHGHLDAAGTRFRRAAELEPGCPGARLGLAMIALDEGQWQEARSLLIAESACEHHSAAQLLKIAELLMHVGLAHRATGLLTSALSSTDEPVFVQRRQRAAAFHHRSTAMFALDQSQHGIADGRRTLRLERTHAMALQNLVLAYLDQGQPLHAGVLLRRYHKSQPMTPLMCRLAWRWRWAMRSRRVRRWVKPKR